MAKSVDEIIESCWNHALIVGRQEGEKAGFSRGVVYVLASLKGMVLSSQIGPKDTETILEFIDRMKEEEGLPRDEDFKGLKAQFTDDVSAVCDSIAALHIRNVTGK